MAKICLDTNVLLENPEILDTLENIVLSSAVLEEIDKLKGSQTIGHKAREVNRKIEANISKIEFVIKDVYDNIPEGWDKDKRDNKIILAALECGAKLLSNDINVRIKAKVVGVECEGLNVKVDIQYKGFLEIDLNDEELADFYADKDNNKWDLNINEYLLIKHNGEIVDKYKWTEKGFKGITKKNIKSLMFGDLKPKDVYQDIAIDSLMSEQFTAITGKAGSGKSLLSLMYCMWAIQNGKYDTIVVLYNPTKIRGSENLGFYKGDAISKGLQNFIGNMLTSKFGDKGMVDTLITQGKLKLVAMSDCRGMEITDNQILYITEAQNTTIDLMKICLSRVSKSAKVIIEGDPSGQVDSNLYSGLNNGMVRMIEVFKGESLFSFVELQNIHRSAIADIVDKM